MASLTNLDEVTKTLEQDLNFIRIKKLLFCAYQGKWAKNSEELHRLNLKEAIEGLCLAAANFHELELLFAQIVSKVNKKSEYETVAQTILSQLEKLYLKSDGTTLPEHHYSDGHASSPPTTYSSPDSETLSRIHPQLSTQFPVVQDLFDVRQKILQQTNPLRAKILVFSVLEGGFSPNERGWSMLRSRDLDTLIRRLLHAYPNVTDLETQLYHASRSLDELDQYTLVAQVLVKALSPLYPSSGTQLLATHVIPEPIPESSPVPDSSENQENEENQDGYFHTGEITQIAPVVPPGFFDTPPRPKDPPPLQKNPPPPDDWQDEQTEAWNSPPSHQSSRAADPDLSALGLHIFKSIKQNLSLEEEIREFIDEGVGAVMKTLETQFQNLEVTLNHRLAVESQERQLIKYQFLQEFIGEFQTLTHKLMTNLHHLETQERKRLNLDSPAPPAPPATSDPSIKILELARQGNPKAIGAWMNQILHTKGIKTTAFVKDECLHIIFEAATLPDVKILAPFVRKKIASLDASQLPPIKIHGRQLGKKSVSWTQKVELDA